MGLDIYLKKFTNYDAYVVRQAEVDQIYEKIKQGVANDKGVSSYQDLSDLDKSNAQALFKYWTKGQSDLNEDGLVEHATQDIEMDSKLHPGNICRLGYFRSSYNDSGLNRVLTNTLGDQSDLYYIFQYNNSSGYYFRPNWQESLLRALDVLNRFNTFVSKNGNYIVEEVRYNPFISVALLPKSSKEAFDIFTRNLGYSKDYNYENRDGLFKCKEPATVHAIIPGTNKSFMGDEIPCVYLICDNPHNYRSYIESLEVIVETIEYVLSQPDVNNYALSWSG